MNENNANPIPLDYENKNPFDLFSLWFSDAQEHQGEANAVALATAGADGRPSVRMVLLKGYDKESFVFYTNLGSRKARQLAENPFAALCFYWRGLDRQIRIEGRMEKTGSDEADAYFATRERGSQIGAWASKQSQPLMAREDFLAEYARKEKEFAGKDIPRPLHWSGFRLVPDYFEFWQGQSHRLHDRLVFTRRDEDWQAGRLYP